MKRLVLAAAIVSLAVPRLASAGEEADHPWSIGAGIGLFGSSPVADLGAPFQLTAPVGPVFTLERLVAPSTSIVMGVRAMGSTRSSSNVTGAIRPGGWESRLTSNIEVAASFGVLRELTSADAPVRFSVIGSVFGAYARRTVDVTSADTTGFEQTETAYDRGFRGGFEGAIALDKPLLDRLTLRLTASLLSVDYAWEKHDAIAAFGQPADDSSGFDVRLSIDPTLELRFAF